ncbi:head-tail connector protein [Cognatishimia sp. F0-27]|uniref:head-tail connector protein n=1 Tax=Cognatishimia sp. F0-27 TaxID=2816855 RepID=UPI001D0C4514|nr:head-tail connector protein [Cognatishimia sp. F0-27]MCC1493422.1 phage head-tail connector protein [Cognatishimia sp. F0-27]
MILVEETQVPDVVLPVVQLRTHLRLGTGFAEDDVQDAVLSSFLRAALAAIEARTSKSLIRRAFLLTLTQWRDASGMVLPIAPVTGITGITLIDKFGAAQNVDPSGFALRVDAQSPRLVPTGSFLPPVPELGSAEVRFEAGYAQDFQELPSDLAQAVLMLAAHYYEYRDETALSQGCMPFGVTSLIARYRPVRLGMTS